MSRPAGGGADFRAQLWVRGLGRHHLDGAATRSLLWALASHTNGELVAWPSERTLAGEAAIAYSTVRALLPQLVKCQALEETEPQRGTRPARYRFTLRDYQGLPRTLETKAPRKASAPPGGAVARPASAPLGDASAPLGAPSAPPSGAEVPEVPEAPLQVVPSGTGEGVDRAPPPPQAAARSSRANGQPERLVPDDVWAMLGGRPDPPKAEAADRQRLDQARAELAERARARTEPAEAIGDGSLQRPLARQVNPPDHHPPEPADPGQPARLDPAEVLAAAGADPAEVAAAAGAG